MAKSELEKTKGGKCNSAFNFIEHYNNYVKSTEDCIALVKDSTAAIQKQEEVTLTTLHFTANRINEYIDSQQKSADDMPVKAEIETVFSTLKSTVDTFTKSIAELTQKLDYSAGSINALPETPALLSDINQNFKDAYNQLNGDIYGEIQKIILKLTNSVSGIADIQKFPETYIDITALYSMRIEKFFTGFEALQDNLLPLAKLFEIQKPPEQKLTGAYKTLNAQKNDLAIQLNTLKQEKQDLSNKVASLEQKYQKSAEAYKTLNEQKNDLADQINTLKQENLRLSNALEADRKSTTDSVPKTIETNTAEQNANKAKKLTEKGDELLKMMALLKNTQRH